MKKILWLSQIIKIIFLGVLFYLIRRYLYISLHANPPYIFGIYTKYLFGIYIILQFCFNYMIYFFYLKTRNRNLIRYTAILVLQFVSIVLPLYFCLQISNRFEKAFILLCYIFTFILINLINDLFEIRLAENLNKLNELAEKLSKEKIIILLKNYLVALMLIILFSILFLNDIFYYLIRTKIPDLEILLFYLFFLLSIIYFAKHYILFSEIFESKSNFSWTVFLVHIVVFLLFAFSILKTKDYYKYVYASVFSSVILLFILHIWSRLLKLKIIFTYKNYWKILVVFLAYFTFMEYFTYKSVFAEIIIRVIYFLTLFLSIYLCQCYSLEEEKFLTKSINYYR